MTSLLEISTWSNEDIRREIEGLLPETSSLQVLKDPQGYWEVTIQDNGTVTYLETALGLNLALLGAYRWVTAPSMPPPSGAWAPRADLPRVITNPLEYLPSDIEENPGDLDPSYLSSVFPKQSD